MLHTIWDFVSITHARLVRATLGQRYWLSLLSVSRINTILICVCIRINVKGRLAFFFFFFGVSGCYLVPGGESAQV